MYTVIIVLIREININAHDVERLYDVIYILCHRLNITARKKEVKINVYVRS